MTEQEFNEAVAAAKKKADKLSCDAIDCKPIDIDWRERLGEDLEGWTSYEAIECSDCGREVVLGAMGEEQHRYVEDQITVTETPDEGEMFRCIDCGHEFEVEYKTGDGYESFECWECPECHTEFYEDYEQRNHCMGYLNSEGPMMNYYYPVRIKDCEKAALAISHLPLCVVEFQDGDTALALTGGGMDLSPEICRAFIAIGYLPPAHFGRPPRMAGWEKDTRWLEMLVCCEESLRIQANWRESAREDVSRMLEEMKAAMTEEAA
jgi:DNA-directed RNA polymerase subunit RPC12/RpoP